MRQRDVATLYRVRHYRKIIEMNYGQLVPWQGQQRKIITKKDTTVRTRSTIDYLTNDSKDSIPPRASARRVAFLFIPLALSMHIDSIGSKLQAMAFVPLSRDIFNEHC